MNDVSVRPVPLVDGLKTLAGDYDLILCDVWGVIHNGIAAYPAAADALMRFRDGGGRVVLVSNAPRPGSAVVTQLDRLGVPRSTFDAIVTSGDITRKAIVERIETVVHHMGPTRDKPLFEGLPVRFGGIDEADYVVCSGFDHEDEREESVEVSRPRLEAMRARDLFMVCANPDLVVERGDRLIPCAGALAAVYEEMGGTVLYAGKPHRPVYDEARAVAARIAGRDTIPLDRILGVGDAFRTDIAGAVAFGIDALFVARGIHTHELGLHDGSLADPRVQDWLARQAVRPNGMMDTLVWET
ncbi:MAG TPA: TIGR01459 family HAD-type hydrolase [Microvirga sp.]|jgi:HAD superfamily hydrolase (TIGR01459 family)|nr:TIGR01459 family HAD-type hydrolase [Microvirga sp.]